jgi:hypothetical protein
MMQRSLAIAAVLGAVIIAVALVYHGRQLAEVSRRLQAMEQRTSGLDSRLEKFSSELPTLVEQAGHNAGRQAVHGMVEEVVQIPLNWLRPKLALGASNAPKQTVSASHTNGPITDQGTLGIRFDIHKPVVTLQTEVKVEILPNLKEVPTLLWPSNDGRQQALTQTNHAGSSELGPTPGPKAK